MRCPKAPEKGEVGPRSNIPFVINLSKRAERSTIVTVIDSRAARRPGRKER